MENMDRIAVIGIPGSGKSTFANKLGNNLGRPIIHLDKEYWTNDWQKKYSKEEWKNFQKELVMKFVFYEKLAIFQWCKLGT